MECHGLNRKDHGFTLIELMVVIAIVATLAGEGINLSAKILSVADVYDALVSSRPYREGWVKEKVLALIQEESGRQFDPKVVAAFLSIVD